MAVSFQPNTTDSLALKVVRGTESGALMSLHLAPAAVTQALRVLYCWGRGGGGGGREKESGGKYYPEQHTNIIASKADSRE